MAHLAHHLHSEQHGGGEHVRPEGNGGYIPLAHAEEKVFGERDGHVHRTASGTAKGRVRVEAAASSDAPPRVSSRHRLSTATDDAGDLLFAKASDSSDSDEGRPRMDMVPLLGREKVEIDDQEAAYVLVFPRQQKHYHGAVDQNAIRGHPKEDWEKIFGTHQEARKKDRCPHELKQGSVSEEVFQTMVRDKFLEILRESGFKAHSIESVDEDEVFLKVHLPLDGEMIQKLATTFQYRLPYQDKCYLDEAPFGTYPGHRPMQIADGTPAPLYQEFSQYSSEKLQPFRHIDEVRLIIKHLASCVSLSEMVRQGIISRHFAGANHAFVKKLNRDWAGFHNILMIPGTTHDEDIRSYFGEEVAFFFRWFSLYIRNLSVLAAFGAFSCFRFLPGFTITQQDRVLVWFGLALIIWETIFHKMSQADITRMCQVWGMDSFNQSEDDLPSYRASLEGTPELSMRRSVTAAVVVIYLLTFVSIITGLNIWFYQAKVNGKHVQFLQPVLQTVLVKVLSFLWRKIAYYLVLWQNHRTQTRFNDSLIKNLSIVKLFVALYPFVYTAFIEKKKSEQCGATLSEAAQMVYRAQSWPSGVHIEHDASTLVPEDQLGFLKGYYYTKTNQTCISGCYPLYCEPVDPSDALDAADSSDWVCITSCTVNLQASLRTLYLTHILLTTIFLIVPVIMTRSLIYREMWKAREKHGREVRYTFLQFQAKCHKVAEYAFASWGGSWVEDFLELVVSYALLACFGICYPLMSAIGFLCLVVEYRLLAYRMTNVTCRPNPRGAVGIGGFQQVFEIVSLIALTANVGIVVVDMHPYRSLPLGKQFGLFILAEKAAITLRTIIAFAVPGDPEDVRVIQDFNNSVKRAQGFKECTSDKQFDYSEIDLSLAHKPSDLPAPGAFHAGGADTTESEGEESDGDGITSAFC